MDTGLIITIILTIINALGGVILGLVLWIIRRIFSNMDKLEIRVESLSHEINHNYVDKRDYQEFLKRINQRLDQILDKLDGKADK